MCNQLLAFFLVNSTCSTGSKYDVDLLRADVGQCKARVQKLKRELVNMDAEVCFKQKGMETLARVKDKVPFKYYVSKQVGWMGSWV